MEYLSALVFPFFILLVESFPPYPYVIEELFKFFLAKWASSTKVAVILSGGTEESQHIPGIGFRPLAKIHGESVVEKALKKLRSHGFKKVFIVARHELLTKFFELVKDGSHYGVEITYVEEQASKGSADFPKSYAHISL